MEPWPATDLVIDIVPSNSTVAACTSDTAEVKAIHRDIEGLPLPGDITLTTDKGYFDSDETKPKQVTKMPDEWGTITAVLKGTTSDAVGVATISASSGNEDGLASVTFVNRVVSVSASPEVLNGSGSSTITATLTHDGNPVSDQVTFTTTFGTFTQSGTSTYSTTTDGSGIATATLSVPSASEAPLVRVTNTNDCNQTVSGHTVVSVFGRAKFADYGVGYSSPLVADLIPDGDLEVAVIAANYVNPQTQQKTSDGRIRLWQSDGTPVFVSNTIIDSTGNNTLSAADIDDKGGVEIAAPARDTAVVYAFGYDSGASTFKPLAGWPSLSEFAFNKAAAALGDANLDGSTEVTAADLSCLVSCWNATGDTNFDWGQDAGEDHKGSPKSVLWRQVTGSTNVSIENSSVALGDMNPSDDNLHIPDAVVGTLDAPHNGSPMNIWGFAGDDYGNHYPDSPPYHLTPGWQPPNADARIHNSPAIGDVNADGYNDIAIGDDDGRLWIWSGHPTSPWWATYTIASGAIWSSPAIAELDEQMCVVFGSDDGRVYAVHADGTPAAGWGGGILLHTGHQVKSSPIIGDVLNTGDPQVITGCTDGNVYVLWKDGANHTGGPMARIWTCTQGAEEQILSTPGICSLDGTLLSLIVGSTDGIYSINLYNASFQPGSTRWPWPAFLYNSARTSCNDTAAYSPVSVSIIGRVRTSAGVGIPGAIVSIEYESGGVPPAVGAHKARVNPVYTAGNTTGGDEINEGGFVINQLPTLSGGARYKLTINKPGYPTRYVYVEPVAGRNVILDVVY